MALKDIQIKALKAAAKVYRMADSDGLAIEVKPTGVKLWRYRYRFNDKANMLGLGEYPTVSLLQARKMRDDARELLAQGVDPAKHKQEAKAERIAEAEAEKIAALTFEEAYNQWLLFWQETKTPAHVDDVNGRYRMYLKPLIGNTPIKNIKTVDCVAVLKKCESTGRLGALEKVKQILNMVFRYHSTLGNIESSPMRDFDNSVLRKRELNNYAHQTTPEGVKAVFNKLATKYSGYSVTHDAAILVAFTALRVTNVAELRWEYIDWDGEQLRLPADFMKTRVDHIAPLSSQSMAILRKRQADDMGSPFVFPSPRNLNNPINDESIRKVLRLQGITQGELTTHGWRHSLSTIMHEKNFEPHIIEQHLAHKTTGVAGTYNKASYLQQRKALAQAWADFLEGK
jgi:integrase